MIKKLAKLFYCPTEFTLDVLGGKWKTVILCYLKVRPCRYSELRQLVPKLSDKVLTERLQELCAAGLVVREKKRGTKGSEVYVLTAKGNSLRQLLTDLYKWGVANAKDFGVKVGTPLKDLRLG